MRAVFGLLLIMLGLALAVVWMPEQNGERQLAVVTQIATQGIAVHQGANNRDGRTFSPATPLMATVEAPGQRQATMTAGVARVVQPLPSREPVARTEQIQLTTTTTSIVAQTVPGSSVLQQGQANGQPVRQPEAMSGQRQQPMSDASRYDLVRNLQRELKRVGCYWGDIDGDWGTGSKRAMSNFTDRVNASLPIDQPDFILLTLVQGQSGSVCGKGCPAGQALSDSGRCLPNAVMAQGRRGLDRRAPATREDAGAAPSPQVAAVAPSTDSGWRTQVTKAPEFTGRTWIESSATDRTATIAAAGAVAVAAATLPGRMAIGGPQSGGGAFAAPAPERNPARPAVRSAAPAQPDVDDQSPSATPTTTSRRERSRRAAAGSTFRYTYAPPAQAYRAPRAASRNYVATTPRRTRSWTASFFSIN